MKKPDEIHFTVKEMKEVCRACYSVERLEELWAGREYVTLYDIIEMPIDETDKVWCFRRAVFKKYYYRCRIISWGIDKMNNIINYRYSKKSLYIIADLLNGLVPNEIADLLTGLVPNEIDTF